MGSPSRLMKSHMDRFRVRLPSASTPASAASLPTLSIDPSPNTSTPVPTPRHGPPPAPAAGKAVACDRCRHFKKKCSKTPPQCTTCAAAGLKCSLAVVTPASAAELRARLAWVENFINQHHLLGTGQAIQELATGTDLSSIADNSGLAVAAVAPSPSVAGSIPHHHGSPTSLVRSVGRHQDADARTVEEVNSPDVPPPKRPRLQSASAVSDRPADDAVLHVLPESPEEQTGRLFVDAYFRDVHRAYPFVDRDRILATLEAEGGRVFSMKERDADSIIIYLIMAIGYTALQRAGQVPPNVDLSFEVEYKEVLAECLLHETTDTVQILLLLAIYSVSDPRGFSTQPIIDMLARQAIRLGLTQRELADRGLSSAEIERNHRLFWSIYVLDRMIAASTGTPVTLNGANMNVPLPGLTVKEFDSPDCGEHISMLQVARHIIQLRQLEDKVIHQVHLHEPTGTLSITHSDRRVMVANLRTEIEDWYSNGCLLRSTEADDFRIHIRISWLAARYYNLLLLLYYPSHFNPTSSLLSKGELLSITQKHVQANAVRFQHRQLPLNHITLCRLLPVCMIFLHCFLSAQQQPASSPDGGAGDQMLTSLMGGIHEEVSTVADMLEAFPRHFTQAHRAAAMMRQLASVIAASAAWNSLPPIHEPTGRFASTSSTSGTTGGARHSLSESEHAWLYAIRVGLTEVTGQVLGRGSFLGLLLDDSNELAPGFGAGLNRPPAPSKPPSRHVSSSVSTVPPPMMQQQQQQSLGLPLGIVTPSGQDAYHGNHCLDGERDRLVHVRIEADDGDGHGMRRGWENFSIMDFL